MQDEHSGWFILLAFALGALGAYLVLPDYPSPSCGAKGGIAQVVNCP